MFHNYLIPLFLIAQDLLRKAMNFEKEMVEERGKGTHDVGRGGQPAAGMVNTAVRSKLTAGAMGSGLAGALAPE